MKKIVFLIILLAMISVSYLWYFHSEYNIEATKIDVQHNLKEWINRKSGKIDTDIINIVRVDDTTSYVALFKTQNNNIGYAQLIKGWNGKYKIDHSGHGTNLVLYEEVNTNKGRYGILVGKNPDLKIEYIKAVLLNGDYKFTSNVSTDEKFVRYEELPTDVENTFPAELTFYDKNHTVIE